MSRIGSALSFALACVGLAAAEAHASLSELDTALRQFVAERAAVASQEVEIPALRDFEHAATQPGVEFEFSTHPNSDFARLTPVTIVVRSGTDELRRGTVSVRTGETQTLLVARHALRARTIVREEDIESRLHRGVLPKNAITRRADIIGLRTERAMSPGSVFRLPSVAATPLIERGQDVRIRLESGALSIEGAGRAREAGRPGDTIRVLNLTSKREVRGVVNAEGVVDVRH